MKLTAFGRSDAGDDDVPTCGRSNTLAFHKKALSYFMPNKHLGWNMVSLSGNPTRSPEVNDLIKRVRRHEVCGEGVCLQVRCALTLPEFRSLVGIAPNSETFNLQVRIPCILKIQVHLIARVDDAAHVLMSKLRVHGMFDCALRVRLRWMKNCLEERDAPEQIILGASYQDFCVLTSLSIHLQYLLEFLNGENSDYLFCNSSKTTEMVKALIGKAIRDHVSNNEGWRNLQEEGVDIGPVGSLSNQKLASTLAHQQGCTQGDIDCHGRWRNTWCISDRYTDLMLEVVDGKVAAALYMGGPTKYVYREGSGLTDAFLSDEVCPHIRAKFGGRVAVVLDKSLLLACKEPELIPQVPACLRQRVIQAYEGVMQLEEDINPIQKRRIVVYNVGGQLRIDEEGNPGQVGEGQHKANMNNMAGGMQTVTAQIAAIRQENIDLKELDMTQYDVMRDELLRLCRVIGRVANRQLMVNHGFANRQGAQPHGGGGGGGGDDDPEDSTVPYEAMLSNCPRSLFELWQEYEFGLQGQKAAKRFTSRERGRHKYKYHRRKVVWDTILRLLGRGHSIHTAVGEIERVYGEGKLCLHKLIYYGVIGELGIIVC